MVGCCCFSGGSSSGTFKYFFHFLSVKEKPGGELGTARKKEVVKFFSTKKEVVKFFFKSDKFKVGAVRKRGNKKIFLIPFTYRSNEVNKQIMPSDRDAFHHNNEWFHRGFCRSPRVFYADMLERTMIQPQHDIPNFNDIPDFFSMLKGANIHT